MINANQVPAALPTWKTNEIFNIEWIVRAHENWFPAMILQKGGIASAGKAKWTK